MSSPGSTALAIFITIFIIVIIIYIHKIYSIVSKIGGKKQMECYKRYCVKCGKLLDDEGTCSHCNRPSHLHYFAPSSATAYTSIYSDLVDKFEEDPEEKKRKNELVDNIITDILLNSFERWGYLEFTGGKYGFTDFGKDAFYKNLEFRGIKSKNERD